MSDLAGLDHARPAVLQIVPRLDRDEAGSSTVDIARHLRKSGWRAIVASAGGPLERELAMTGAVHATLPLDRASTMGIWRNAGRLARLIHRHGIVVVHARAPAAAWSAARAARRTGTAFMTTVHEAYPVKGRRGYRFHRVMATGARVIAVSEYIAERLVEGFGVSPERIRVVRRW